MWCSMTQIPLEVIGGWRDSFLALVEASSDNVKRSEETFSSPLLKMKYNSGL